MSPRDVALAFVERFSGGDVEGLGVLLAEDLRLRGPLLSCDTRRDYLAALRRDPPAPAGFDVVEAVAEGERVAVLYRYLKADGVTDVAQFFRVVAGRIAETRIVFAASPPASDGEPAGGASPRR